MPAKQYAHNATQWSSLDATFNTTNISTKFSAFCTAFFPTFISANYFAKYSTFTQSE